MSDIILEKIVEYAEKNPNHLVIADSMDTALTYGEFVNNIRICAKLFIDSGLKKGDRVLIRGIHSKEYVISYFAAHMIGAVAVPYEKNIDPDTLAYIVRRVEAELLVTDSACVNMSVKSLDIYKICNGSERFDGEIPVLENDIADILFTTGTTGRPKGVIMTHRNIFRGARNVACGTEMSAEDITMIVAPMNHAYAMGGLRAAMISGAAVVLHESCMRLKEMVDKLDRYHCTGFSTVPATIKILYQYSRGALDRILGKIRYVELGSSSLDVDMKKHLLRILPGTSIYLNYGSTEAPRNIYMDLRKFPDKLTTIGKPAVNAVVRVVDEEGRILPEGDKNAGRLVIEGDMVTPGYWLDEEESKLVLDGNRFYTNDIGYMDEDGFVYLLGRKNDLLNIGGELVSPLEIESVANQCKYVEVSACIAIKDENALLGEKIVLFVESTGAAAEHSLEKEIFQFLEERLDNRRMPNEIKIIQKMPANYVGKLDRKKLLEYL